MLDININKFGSYKKNQQRQHSKSSMKHELWHGMDRNASSKWKSEGRTTNCVPIKQTKEERKKKKRTQIMEDEQLFHKCYFTFFFLNLFVFILWLRSWCILFFCCFLEKMFSLCCLFHFHPKDKKACVCFFSRLHSGGIFGICFLLTFASIIKTPQCFQMFAVCNYIMLITFSSSFILVPVSNMSLSI